ncbi:hypothetical protein CMI45_03625 [Candidatus Pacearchaeota archaeon]|nr:hypothetical protein [Candidatus Pacearchaeota archaeon]|tara:strand:+ start:14494 stop:15609 length:1116 start_codon:yes stop_codon:yes gene_type:complete
MIISSLSVKTILDSRRDKTIQVSVNHQKASAPYGASVGKHETPTYRKTLSDDIKKIKSAKLKGIEINSFSDLKKIEKLLRKKLGANSLFALESAILKALAKSKKKELWQVISPNLKSPKLPIPLGNVVEGGMHAHNKCPPTFQEFFLISSKKSVKENVKILSSFHKQVKRKVKSQRKSDEGAWETELNNEQVLTALSKFKGVRIGIDAAVSAFYKDKEYYYNNNKVLDKNSQIRYINSLIKKYNLLYVEDPLDEEDFSGFSKISKKTLVTGDDLTATQISRTKKAIKMKSMNAMIIKPNQNGSLLDLAEIFKLCKKHKIKTILSHRSGETLDNALADYAVAFQADYIKTGIATKWRTVKLKRLIEIEKQSR